MRSWGPGRLWLQRGGSQQQQCLRVAGATARNPPTPVSSQLRRIVQEATQLSGMAGRFPDFDLQGKQMYLDKVRLECVEGG